uniref:tRNA selenocysteine-associated protein 1 n=1 Tax=Acrobeloides nanus TaxID=290746 RepID=A0A914EAF7_9BILA
MENDEGLDYFDYQTHDDGEPHEHEDEIDDVKEESQDVKTEHNESDDTNPTLDSGLAVVDTGNYDEAPQSVQSYQQQNQQWQVVGGGQQQQQQPFVPRTLPIEKTLWMGDLNPEWTDEFIKEAFAKFDMKINYVKMVQQNEKNKTMSGKDGKTATYCFVEFEDEEAARYAMLHINGRSIPNDPDRGRFNLSYANAPGQVYTEYNLFVNDLSSSVDDATLFKLFGERYKSCRGAKIYRYPDGKSKGSGFIKFTSQTDQQRALVELNKYRLKGRELKLRLANPLQRGGPRNQVQQQTYAYPAGMAPYQAGIMAAQSYGMGQPGMQSYQASDHYESRRSSSRRRDRDDRDYDRRDRDRKRDRRRDSRSPEVVKPKLPVPTYFEDSTPLTTDEHNDLYMAESEELFAALESSRWSRIWVAPEMRHKDLFNAICAD